MFTYIPGFMNTSEIVVPPAEYTPVGDTFIIEVYPADYTPTGDTFTLEEY